MESRQSVNLLSKFAKARCTCRTFSTHLPKLQAGTPPSSTSQTSPPPPRAPPRPSEAFSLISSLKTDSEKRPHLQKVTRYEEKLRSLNDITKQTRALDLEKQITRKWRPGDIYAPHDLSAIEMQKWRKPRAPDKDVFDMLGINPMSEWKNVSVMGEFVSPMGRIKHRRQTGLRGVNQRKVARAVRRAVAMGLMPSTHRHPEILEADTRDRNLRRQFMGANARVGYARGVLN